MLARAQAFINILSQILGIIGMVVLVAMMLLTGVDVFLRYVFNSPILGSAEITELIMVTLAFVTIVWCTAGKAHIKVDLLSSRIPETGRTISDVLFYFMYLVLASLIAWRSFLEALAVRPTSTSAGAGSSILNIPHYPFYLLIAVACVLIALIMLVYIAHGITQVVKKWT
jgi:TRAP-type C4-dicarboxylate transport system permease small subunit